MKTSNKNALTLVEMLIAIIASAIVILLVTTVLIMAFRAWNTNNAYVRLRRDAAFAMELMVRDIQEANGFNANAPNILTVTNDAKSYVAVFTLNPTNRVLSYSRNGIPIVPLVAQDIATFTPSPHTNESASVDGVNIHLEMTDDRFNIAITSETFVHMRN